MVRNKTIQKAAISNTVAQSVPSLAQLSTCVEDVRLALAALDSDSGPADPVDYNDLMGRLVSSNGRLPPLYQELVYEPFLNTLSSLGSNGFVRLLLNDPNRERDAGLVLDVAHAILQNGERYEEMASP